MKTKRKTVNTMPSQATAMAKALETAGVAVAGLAGTGVKNAMVIEGAMHNADEVLKNKTTILSCPWDTIEQLEKYSAFWGDVALRTLTGNIGYYAVGSVMWAFRKRNQEPAITSDIDAFNGMLADLKSREFNEEVTELQGNRALPFINGEPLVAAYKWLFIECSRNQTNPNYELPSPAVMYMRNQKRDIDTGAIADEYEKFEMEQMKNSPTYEYVKAAVDENKAKDDTRAVKKAKTELDHIHMVIRDTAVEKFNDDVWAKIPLWGQYKFTRSLLNQCMKATAIELTKPAEERLYVKELVKLGEDVVMELQAARRTEQVIMAFDKGNLNEKHEVKIK